MSRTAVLALAVTLTVAYPVAASSQSLHATPAVSVAGDGLSRAEVYAIPKVLAR